ncbi:MAG TPA: TlpA disulfide reductase family protein [Vicinamibacterales bacterium]
MSRPCVIVGLLALLCSLGPAATQTRVRATLSAASERLPAPAFQLRDAAGKPIALSQFRGRPVVVNLWATECGGCRLELPSFVALHRAVTGAAVIGVSMDVMCDGLQNAAEGWAKVRSFAASHQLRYTILMDDGSVEKAYHVTAMPATYLIDRRGRIAARYVGVVDEANLNANVRKLLSEAK